MVAFLERRDFSLVPVSLTACFNQGPMVANLLPLLLPSPTPGPLDPSLQAPGDGDCGFHVLRNALRATPCLDEPPAFSIKALRRQMASWVLDCGLAVVLMEPNLVAADHPSGSIATWAQR
jgi:hypothetical protein